MSGSRKQKTSRLGHFTKWLAKKLLSISFVLHEISHTDHRKIKTAQLRAENLKWMTKKELSVATFLLIKHEYGFRDKLSVMSSNSQTLIYLSIFACKQEIIATVLKMLIYFHFSFWSSNQAYSLILKVQLSIVWQSCY